MGIAGMGVPNWTVGGSFFGLEGVTEKYVVCFLVYLFLGFFIKNGGMCNNYKKRIVTSFLCVFMVEKGMCELGVLDSCQTHYSLSNF